MVQSGEIARAARALTSQGVAPATSEVLEKLKLKHPVGHINSSDIPDIPDSVETIQLDKATFIKVLKNAPRNSGCGPTGWRYERVRVLLDNVITSDLLYLVCNNIASGEIPSKIIPLLSASTLIALLKHGSDVRRIAAKAICQQKSLDFAAYFTPLQHGIATPGGVELLTHHIQVLLEINSDWSILKTDVKTPSIQSLDSVFYIRLQRTSRTYIHM